MRDPAAPGAERSRTVLCIWPRLQSPRNDDWSLNVEWDVVASYHWPLETWEWGPRSSRGPFPWIQGGCQEGWNACTTVSKPKGNVSICGDLEKSCGVRGQTATYILQRGDGGTIPSIVRVPVHVQHLLPLHGHDPGQDAFLEETREWSFSTTSLRHVTTMNRGHSKWSHCLYNIMNGKIVVLKQAASPW